MSNKALIASRMSPSHVAITSSIKASFGKLSFTVWVIGMSPVDLGIGMSPVELQPDMPFRADFWIFHVVHKPNWPFRDACRCECEWVPIYNALTYLINLNACV